jgi:hypothetical protein
MVKLPQAIGQKDANRAAGLLEPARERTVLEEDRRRCPTVFPEMPGQARKGALGSTGLGAGAYEEDPVHRST